MGGAFTSQSFKAYLVYHCRCFWVEGFHLTSNCMIFVLPVTTNSPQLRRKKCFLWGGIDPRCSPMKKNSKNTSASLSGGSQTLRCTIRGSTTRILLLDLPQKPKCTWLMTSLHCLKLKIGQDMPGPKMKLHLPTIHFQWQAVVSFREGEVLNENILFYEFVAFGGLGLGFRFTWPTWSVGDWAVLLPPQYRWKQT